MMEGLEDVIVIMCLLGGISAGLIIGILVMLR